jgi:hypothetical protein
MHLTALVLLGPRCDARTPALVDVIGPPFMRVQGISIVLSENQEVAGVVDKLALVALQRFSDGDNKVMKIVIRQWAP